MDKSNSSNRLDLPETEIKKIMLHRIRHEDELRNQRINWLLFFHGFLFATLGQTWSLKSLSLLLAVVGIFSSLSVWFGSTCNGRAIRKIRERGGYKKIDNEDIFAPIRTGDIIKNEWLQNFVKFFYPWNFLPLLLSLTWSFLLIGVMLGKLP